MTRRAMVIFHDRTYWPPKKTPELEKLFHDISVILKVSSKGLFIADNVKYTIEMDVDDDFDPKAKELDLHKSFRARHLLTVAMM